MNHPVVADHEEQHSMQEAPALRERLAAMVAWASDGTVSATEALAATVPLSALGVTSLAQMRLIDAVEREFGIEFDFSDDTVDVLNDLAALERRITEAA
ncbi:acyl carrier protein [Planobispora rosea]|uniref:acyl carrier protein n=1 Tax=Planobispora rosea TaxID=35762 RepID=UPI000B23F6DF|nr:acyl carrier protein [Planobispora rosea]